ncbi:hypothetical protein BDZ89DRAFT_1070007 [Hymenopellis radicata]|nr:hypothetical protein BDZ89DRAFT_1070007 [Hymenopellis radicata]
MLFILALVAASASMVSASPVEARSMCTPAGFQTKGLTILNSAREWAIEGSQSGAQIIARLRITDPDYPEFTFDQRDDGEGYTITEINNKGLVVTHSDVTGILELTAKQSHNFAQIWNVQCNNCDSPSFTTGHYAGLGCNIVNVNSGFCVQTGPKIDDPMYLATCNGNFGQMFDMWVHP